MLIECVICLENLQSSEAIYHTPCGHVFHHSCLTRWFKRSKTCPECREKIPERKISRLYLNFVNNNPATDAAIVSSLQTQISGLNHELLIKELEIIESNSNNSKLSLALKSKDDEIQKLKGSILIALEDRNVWKSHMEGQKREVESLKQDIARITKERDDILSSNRSWEKVSQMFHGITDHNTLINMISVMMSELATCTSSRWELQRTVMQLQRELTEVSEARMFFATERVKKSEMESNLASLEIEKLSLQRRIEDLEDMVESGVKPETFVRQKPLPELSVASYNSIPFKKRKVETTDKLCGIAGGPATPIDVIDLTVEPVRPLIDLTKDTAESSVSPAPSPEFWLLSPSVLLNALVNKRLVKRA